jgi:hypothetical protein
MESSNMTEKETHGGGMLAGPFIMFISAALFGYFGFFIGLTSTTAAGQVVFFFALLVWTLKVGAIGFIVSAVLTLIAPLAGNLVYAVIGLLTAAALVVIGFMDIADTQHAAALPPLLAFLFAAWNGYGSWYGLKAVLSIRRAVAANRPNPFDQVGGN